jgi:hypothetical protein
MTNDGGTTSYAYSSILVKLKFVKDLNKLDMAGMVIKMSCTPMLGFTYCPPPSCNPVGVKNSQVLTHAMRLALQFDVWHQSHQGAPRRYLRSLSQN